MDIGPLSNLSFNVAELVWLGRFLGTEIEVVLPSTLR